VASDRRFPALARPASKARAPREQPAKTTRTVLRRFAAALLALVISELPVVGSGARCVSGTNVCAPGLTCTDPNRPGFCCAANCSGPCQACSEAGTCDPVPDQTKGGCGGNKVCVNGSCGCSGLDRESLDCGGDRCIRDVADACCDDDGCSAGDVCGANNLCGCPVGTRECTPGGNDCTPTDQCCNCAGPCQACTNGTCGTVPDGQPGRCGAGQECRLGGCVTSAPTLSAAGATCTTASQCQSGVCTGGVCCQGNCSGACSTCQQGTGACINVAPRTPCGAAGSHLLCIGNSCTLPAVGCAGESTQVTTTMACCVSRAASGAATETFTSIAACPQVGIDVGQATTPVTCDEHADCPAGELCCLHNNGEASSVGCFPESECNSFETIPVCSSPAGSTATCSEGTCENFFLEGFVPGWQFCNP
jgi:hypothetical protein